MVLWLPIRSRHHADGILGATIRILEKEMDLIGTREDDRLTLQQRLTNER